MYPARLCNDATSDICRDFDACLGQERKLFEGWQPDFQCINVLNWAACGDMTPTGPVRYWPETGHQTFPDGK